VSAKKHTLRVTILKEEYSIRSDTPPEPFRNAPRASRASTAVCKNRALPSVCS
jgi:hypothetical protein